MDVLTIVAVVVVLGVACGIARAIAVRSKQRKAHQRYYQRPSVETWAQRYEDANRIADEALVEYTHRDWR